MSTPETVLMEMTRPEALHLAELVRQFRALLHEHEGAEDAASAPADPAIARLVPDAYADDVDAARQFRELTAADLLSGRDHDAQTVLACLAPVTDAAASHEDDDMHPRVLELSPDQLEAWLRTLAALRLVLATRLHIRTETDHAGSDPRYGIYEWLGYRLELLVQAADAS